MKCRIGFKNPDVVADTIADLEDNMYDEEEDEDSDKNEEARNKIDKLTELIKAYVDYEEYVTIEFDTDTNTATVVKLPSHEEN